MRYTHEYELLQRQLHENPEYGISGQRYSDHVKQILNQYQTRDVLDYGAGKGTLQKSLPFPIQNYDPFVPEYSKRPVPADIVVCTDVMEHIEPSCVMAVIADLRSLTKRAIFLEIATGPAKKFLSDGRNAHLIQENVNWWLPLFTPFFNLEALHNQDTGFVSIWTPIVSTETSSDTAKTPSDD